MISATEQPWNSATTLYIARKLEEIGHTFDRPLQVLDMGCGSGRIVRQLHPYGHDLYGYDLERIAPNAVKTLTELYGSTEFERRFRFTTSEREIPFDDNSFDVIYANQVFEHVRFIDQMIAECARVLRPGGVLVTLFPFVTYPLEGHVKIPFVHWLPPGNFRVQYMRLFFLLRLRPLWGDRAPLQTAQQWEKYLKTRTFYRTMSEVTSLAEYYFEDWVLDAEGYVRARLDMWEARTASRWQPALARVVAPFEGASLATLVNHYWCSVLVIQGPKSSPGDEA